ncbi:MAG: DUF503 domain-containing protein [Acidobacteriota bacterium]
MRIGLYTFKIFLPACHSLKDKRRVIKSIKDRMRSRYNVAVSEVDGHDLWQSSTIAIVSVSNEDSLLEETFQKIHGEIENMLPGNIIEEKVEFF